MIPTVISVKDVNKLTELIYVRYNFKDEFILLLDFESKPFETMNEAQDFLRTHIKGCYWEISTYEQAIMGNGMRDNV
jgi:hypothetical protein